ncbi:uncharacterized protein BDR25DRAFT_325227 [Lindgomyces ingoldianus]|uniref:Uncharacterized protein n=1 Tax=Lindgomyces ingoldianus TaxID=673940 RepID=A0ACB6QWK4_9PLEO|nr:uncharacterized protein BDR25DRAFT_325227 [Lindgomyces ingoldianus]KAF2470890.1 hypothetical protein BDR25DRAFT_325227 [Lindgomyces ingoldianus]
MATYYMYFPFLTCEVRCGAVALDIADRQNAHSMTLAVRAVVELFRLVKREKEIHRKSSPSPFTALEGNEKWTAHKFTKNVYDAWMLTHFKRLCLAVDHLPPELDFGVPPLLQGSGLSQGLESHHLSQSLAESAS